jgi:hypothetical protein
MGQYVPLSLGRNQTSEVEQATHFLKPAERGLNKRQRMSSFTFHIYDAFFLR